MKSSKLEICILIFVIYGDNDDHELVIYSAPRTEYTHRHTERPKRFMYILYVYIYKYTIQAETVYIVRRQNK